MSSGKEQQRVNFVEGVPSVNRYFRYMFHYKKCCGNI